MRTKREVRAIYFLVFAPLGVYVPYLPVYFREAGRSAAEISVLFAIAPALKLLTSPLWGHVIDVTGDRRRFFLIAASLAALGSAVWVSTAALVPAMLGMAVYAFARGPLPALADTAAVELSQTKGHDYSRMRIWGSIGFVAASITVGFAVERGGLGSVPLWLFAVNLALAVAAWTIGRDEVPVPAKTSGGRAGVLSRGVVILLAASTLHQIALSPYNTFYGIHLADLGLPPSAIGTSWAAAVGAEIVVLLAAGRAVTRFGTKNLLVFSMAISALRWFAVARLDGVVALVAVQTLHAFSFGTYLVAAVTYIGTEVPESRRTMGQTLFGAVSFGLGPLIGTLVAGQAYQHLGGAGMFNAAGFIEVAAAVLIALALADPRRR